jgi:hypothetical protein
VSLDDAGVPRQGQAGDDGVAVPIDAGRESVETGKVVLADGVEPLRESLPCRSVSMWAKDRT